MTETVTPPPATTGIHEDIDRWLAEQPPDEEAGRLAADLRTAETAVAGVRRRLELVAARRQAGFG